MLPGFHHKQYLIRIGTMNVFVRLLDEGREELQLQTKRLIPILCKLMSDPNADVREAALSTLSHTMLIFGENICESIRNARLISDAKFFNKISYMIS
ncbi:HEAT repeat protein [Dictyocaulus viviparus]|uniref:HEAT repeat protein n=1 Tax=Dictyocaulus viviparus TaxID=29172 RepID=A0A0D8YEI1_DICVI|nr:HEAT repeat protein [Dictyocaulus viviparus]